MPIDLPVPGDLVPTWLSSGSAVSSHLADEAGRLALLAVIIAVLIMIALLMAGRIYWRWKSTRLTAPSESEIVSPDLLTEGSPCSLQMPAGSGLWSGDSLIRAIERKWIALAAPSNESAPLAVGIPLCVTVPSAAALFRFYATVVDKRIVEGVPTIFVAKPEWVEKIQRREHFRVAANLPSILSLIDPGADAGKSMRGTIADLSAGGFRMAVPEPLRDGAIVRVRLPVEALAGYSFEARVVRCVAAHDFGPHRYRTQCQFLHLTEDTRNLIVAYCFEAQREIRREER